MFSTGLSAIRPSANPGQEGQPTPIRKPVKLQFGQASTPSQPGMDVVNPDFSVWRHTALRYGGYADEMGEFMVPYTGALGKFLGYLVSGLYCVADLGTSLTQKFKNASPELTTAQKTRKTAAEGVDLSFFHLMASLLIPPKVIGALVESVDHLLDRESLEHALHEAREARQANPSSGLLERISHKKLALEARLNRTLAPHVERFLAKKQAENGLLVRKMEAASDWLLNQHGPDVAPFVKATADLAERYNRWMPITSFKDEEIGRKLKENIDFLKSPDIRLSRQQITKLAWIKPIPVLLGMFMIPIVAHPFDRLMSKVQNWTTRPLVGKNHIIREGEELKSVRNTEFWGQHPKNVTRHGKKHHPPSTFTGHVLQAHYHRQAARFGTMAYYPYQYRYQPGSMLLTPQQPGNVLPRPVYPTGNRGFYC